MERQNEKLKRFFYGVQRTKAAIFSDSAREGAQSRVLAVGCIESCVLINTVVPSAAGSFKLSLRREQIANNEQAIMSIIVYCKLSSNTYLFLAI